jgi:DNA-binding transcriptional ArsR family regulator
MPYGRDMSTIEETGSGWDYEAEETLVVSEPEQLRALADDLRAGIISLLRSRARSTQGLARELDVPKGTVGHHVKVLERAGLVRIVRTRQVRAVTEKFYGRTARLFLFAAEDEADERGLGAGLFRQAAREIDSSPHVATFGQAMARLTPADLARLERRLKRLMEAFTAADSAGGTSYRLPFALYRDV